MKMVVLETRKEMWNKRVRHRLNKMRKQILKDIIGG